MNDIDHAFAAGGARGVTPESTYSGALSFARRKYSKDLAGVDLAVTGVPFDTATTNHQPARLRLHRPAAHRRRLPVPCASIFEKALTIGPGGAVT